ncbi:matE family protein [Mycobacterium xenopi 4042]|uniref:Probable multidrug resistance protein NorM n=1 Tax=Mycobacterium xenopi 4042 TaxID=1299334 RepID=X8A7M2_MYCXE|nr:matE family protein [Mycobacterium xenopi 4042]
MVNQLTRIAFQVSIGLSHGSSILISRAIGRLDRQQAQQTANAALVLGWLTTATLAVVYVAVPNWVLRPFLDPTATATIVLAKVFLLFAIVQQVVDFTQNIAIGLLRGIGDTATGLRATTIGYWIAGVPAMLLLAFPRACTAGRMAGDEHRIRHHSSLAAAPIPPRPARTAPPGSPH